MTWGGGGSHALVGGFETRPGPQQLSHLLIVGGLERCHLFLPDEQGRVLAGTAKHEQLDASMQQHLQQAATVTGARRRSRPCRADIG